jgi:dipeptidyl aminopeptidase/acylaminoacyl peptidase
VVNGEVPLYLSSFHRLVDAGFMVFAPMYRGSDGAAGHDELGGSDLHDLINAVTLASKFANADSSNMFLYGESRGGVMTLEALHEHVPVNAAVTVGAFTDLQQYFLEMPQLEKNMAEVVWPDYEMHREQILDRRSAVRWASEIGTPLLLMHGGKDRSVSPLHTLRFAEALEKSSKEYALIVYSGDGHVLAKNRVDRDAQAVAWFRAHMTAGGTKP